VITQPQSGGAPVLRIRPHRGWAPLNLGELWAFRELLYFFVWRDLKVRYKQTAFGVGWAIAQPVLLMVVLTLFLGRLAVLAPRDVAYPLFLFAGLVPWTLFARSVAGASDSLVAASNLIQKVYFPRLLLPLSAIGSVIIDFGIALGVLGLLILYFQHPVSATIVWAFPLFLLAAASASAVGIWLSAVNVRYRDVRHTVPFLVQVWFFASPVAYAMEAIPGEWRTIYSLNPMVGVVDGFRWALLGGAAPPVQAIAVSAAITAAALVGGLAYFRRVERTFADVI
jgi:lipopolysaccharide transport system permease protein